MFKPSICRYSTRSQMTLDISLPKIWYKTNPTMKNVKTTLTFMHALKKNILLHLQALIQILTTILWSILSCNYLMSILLLLLPLLVSF